MKRFRWIVGLLALAGIALFVQAASKNGLDSGDLIVDMDNGLTWVADSRYPLTVRAARSVVVPRSQGEEFISRMNSGEFENFGFLDWRLPTTEELEYVARSAAFNRQVGDLDELRYFLGLSGGGITARKGNDLVYAWPVRFQDDMGGGPPAAPAQTVILGTNSVSVNKNAVISGDIITSQSGGGTLAPGFELRIDAFSDIDGSLRADRISLKKNTTISGDAEVNQLDQHEDAVIEGAVSDCGPPCSLPALPFFHMPEGDLTNHVNVPDFGAMTLPEGDYGNITAGKNSTLCFSGGIYNINSIGAGTGVDLLFDTASDLRIAGKVETGKNSVIGPSDCAAGGVLPTASEIIFYVSGINGTSGGLSETPEALKIGQDQTVDANFYVPFGTAGFGKNLEFSGAAIGRDVDIDAFSTMTADSFFVGANQAPIANGQTVFADAGGETTIIITANDPEGGDLTFSIVSGPTAPNSLILTENPPPDPGDPVGCDPEIENDCITPPFPNRSSATVVFSGSGPDSFVFRATDSGGASGIATVLIDPDNTREDAPAPLAENVNVSTQTGSPVSFNLRGNSGGTTPSSSISSRNSISARAIAITLASVGGGVEDTDDDGFGDAADAASEIVRAFRAGPVLFFSEDSNGNGLYRLNRFTGAATNLGASGVTSSTVGLTVSQDPRVLFGSRFAGFTEINADGSGFTVVDSSSATGSCGSFSCPAYEGLAADAASGTVYGIINGTFGIVDPSNGDLVTVLASAEFCDDGSEATCDIEGIAFGNGGVYGIVGDNGPATGDSTVDDLFFYNPGTDSWSVVGPTGIDWDLVGLAYDPDQDLLYAKGSQDSNLYSINPATGATSVVGDTGISAGGGLALIARSPQESSSVGRVQIEVDADFCAGSVGATGFAASLDLSVAGSLADSTFFFAGTTNQDELLTASDFEAPVTMSGGQILAGDTSGSVSLDVTELVTAALSAPGSNGIFSIQGRVDESGSGAAGIGIFSENSASGPALVCSTPPPLPPLLSWTILSLPSSGTLTNAQGNPVMINDIFTGPPEPVLTFTPTVSGVFTFQVEVEDLIAVMTDISTVTISVSDDECTVVGRPVGCEPQNP